MARPTPGRPQESPQEPQIPESARVPESPKDAADKVRAAAESKIRDAEKAVGEATRKHGTLLRDAEGVTRTSFRDALKEGGFKPDLADAYMKENKYQELQGTGPEERQPGVPELYNREIKKYVGSKDTWSVPKGVAKADRSNDIFLYKRGKNEKGEPVLYAMAPAGGYQQLDLKTGEWTILTSLTDDQKKDLTGYRNTVNSLRKDGKILETDDKESLLNRDVEEQVLKVKGLTKKQYDEFKAKNPDAWKGNKDNEAEQARLDMFMEMQLRENELAAAKGRVDKQPKGPVAAVTSAGAEVAGGEAEKKEALEKSPEQMTEELNVEWAKVHALVKDSESIKGTPIGSLFADKEKPFEVKAEDDYVHMRLEGDQKEALTSIGRNIGYRVEGDTLKRGKNEELDLKGAEITMDLHEWTGAAKPQSAAEKMVVFGRSMDLMKTWEGRFATAPDSQLVLNFDKLEKQKDEGKWEKDSIAQGKLKDIVSKMPKDLVDPKTGRPCGRALEKAVMKKDKDGNLLIAFPADSQNVDDFKHFHQSWWPGSEQHSVKERVEKKEGEEAAKTVEFGIVVTDGGFTAMLRDIEIRMLGKDVKEEEKPKGDGIAGSPGEKTPEEKEEDAKDPEKRVEKLSKTLEGLLKDRGESVKRVDELKPRKEKLNKDLKEATNHLNGAKSEVTEAQNAVKKAEEDVKKIEKSKVEGDKDLLPAKRIELEGLRKVQSGQEQVRDAKQQRMEKLDEQYKKVGVDLEASEKTVTEVSDKIKKLVDEELEKLGEGKSKEGGYTFEGENKYEYTLGKTKFKYEKSAGGDSEMSLEKLFKLAKEGKKLSPEPPNSREREPDNGQQETPEKRQQPLGVEEEKRLSIRKDGQWHLHTEVTHGKEGWQYLLHSGNDLMYAKRGEEVEVYAAQQWIDAAAHAGIRKPEEAVKYRQTIAEQRFEDKWVAIASGARSWEYKIAKSGSLVARKMENNQPVYEVFNVAAEEWKSVSGKDIA